MPQKKSKGMNKGSLWRDVSFKKQLHQHPRQIYATLWRSCWVTCPKHTPALHDVSLTKTNMPMEDRCWQILNSARNKMRQLLWECEPSLLTFLKGALLRKTELFSMSFWVIGRASYSNNQINTKKMRISRWADFFCVPSLQRAVWILMI